MLRQLHITGLGVIDDLDLELHPGLNVLTGETGAGKTMVALGLSLALGARAGAHLVREGALSARVQARFDAPAGAGEWAEDGEVILARSVGADGKSSARIGGQLATASSLAGLGEGLVEVLGQHQNLALLRPTVQTAFLDRYAGDAHLAALGSYRETYRALAAARSELESVLVSARDRERELDLLVYQVGEIEAVDPVAGESESLASEEARLGHVERLLELSGGAGAALADEQGAVDALASATVSIEHAADLDPSAVSLAIRARALSNEITELARDVRDYRESLASDPTRLLEVRDRAASLKALQRKYGADEHEVLAFLAQASARLHDLSTADDRADELRHRAEELARQALEQARSVTVGRTPAFPRLADAIRSELRALGMPEAVIEIALVTLDELGPAGAELAELRFAADPTHTPAPVGKTASGGELSRVMLACRSVLADLDDVPTLVFDEVDAGIGGEAGLAVGRRLALLAVDRQVLVVTHLPQIACFADRHMRVRKDAGTATVEVLDDDERVRELSRMLAGLESSTHAVSHAGELLVEAAKVRAGAR